MLNQFKTTIKTKTRRILAALNCHRSLYAGLSGTHIWAAMATHKPEVYVPIAALYLILSIKE